MVVWSIPAKDDHRSIYDYIAKDSSFYADRVIDKIIERTDSLELFPESGRLVPEIDDAITREIFVYSYRVIL
jgi:plasmid stabilization system protein ParE